MTPPTSAARLSKRLTLFDVYAVATGAMFSSGFFLLPGLAAAQTGGTAFLAYLAAGVLICPAMFSVAELATAMPRAGGAYYFIDRSMGPLMGTIGGLGSWMALVLKSAFALLGMGAYLAVHVELPIKPLAIALTLMFGAVNLIGAKEGAGLQRVLVIALVGIMGWYIAEGVLWLFDDPHARMTIAHLGPMMTRGIDGFFATIGLVFVSYAGLTKVASVAEEVQNPDRNIPLGMMLALFTATAIYVLGVALIQLALPIDVLHADKTPVSTAGAVFFDSMTPEVGAWLIVVAAIAAFASTGNAGVMSAARYPLAMARDKLMPSRFAVLGRFGTPTLGIAATTAAMALIIAAFDIAAVAKLASAFQLALFGLLCGAVIVMRESRISYYQPGFRSPLYPWMQIAGLIIPAWLIVEMGWLAVLFIAVVSAACVAWYLLYARRRIQRSGAVFHVFARLGERAYLKLDAELRLILAERGLRESDAFEAAVGRAHVIDVERTDDFEAALAEGCAALAERLGLSGDELLATLRDEMRLGLMPIARGVALPHIRVDAVDSPQLVLMRVRAGVPLAPAPGEAPSNVHAVFLLVSPLDHPDRHLRMLARLAERIDDDAFLGAWQGAADEFDLKELLLREDRFVTFSLDPDDELTGRPVLDAGLPPDVSIAFIRRGGRSFVPRATDLLQAGDRLTVIGEPEVLAAVVKRYDAAPA